MFPPRCRRSRAPAVALIAVLTLNGCGGGDSTGTPPVIQAPTGLSYPTPPTYFVGAAIDTLTPTVTGMPTAYSVSPALPLGLTLNPTHGWITGTPAVPIPAASYVIRAENAGGAASTSLLITVDPPAPVLRLEPISGTTIGIGQALDLHVAYRSLSTDPYPAYVDKDQVAWNSSQPAIATVGPDGVVSGVSQGTTMITASYRSLSKQVPIGVGGTYLNREVTVPGQGSRRYAILSPSGVAAGKPLPVLVTMHGGGGTARIQASTSLLSALAQTRKVLVVYLEGSGVIQTFNAGSCCGYAQTNQVDDVTYVRAVLDDLAVRDVIDPARIYATGFSNGGMMAHRLACALADRLAGIAAIAGASGQFDKDLNQFYACNPARPIPVLHVHATNDRNYPFTGGVGSGISSTNFYPVASTVSDWIVRNNVTAQAVTEFLAPTTICVRYASPADAAKPSAPVTLCTVDPPDVYDPTTEVVFGGGHSWPGGNRSPSPSSDVPVTDFSANDYMWRYFGN
ncbi:MAG: PHB depolymerase family esterase [Nitrospiraceae bacterium]